MNLMGWLAWCLKLLNPIFNIFSYEYDGGKISLRPASTGFLLGLHFDPKYGGDMFLRSVELSPNYTVLQPRRPCSSHLTRGLAPQHCLHKARRTLVRREAYEC
jgi:hypothetical protein